MTHSVTASIGKEHYKTDVVIGSRAFVADELPEYGGAGLGPTPSELFSSAIASCTAITLRMYADRKGYAIEKIDVDVQLTRKDIGGVTHSHLERTIRITGTISEEERKRLLQIADKCPTHKMLKGEIVIDSTIT